MPNQSEASCCLAVRSQQQGNSEPKLLVLFSPWLEHLQNKVEAEAGNPNSTDIPFQHVAGCVTERNRQHNQEGGEILYISLISGMLTVISLPPTHDQKESSDISGNLRSPVASLRSEADLRTKLHRDGFHLSTRIPATNNTSSTNVIAAPIASSPPPSHEAERTRDRSGWADRPSGAGESSIRQ